MGNIWKTYGNIYGKYMENIWEISGKYMEKYGKSSVFMAGFLSGFYHRTMAGIVPPCLIEGVEWLKKPLVPQ